LKLQASVPLLITVLRLFLGPAFVWLMMRDPPLVLPLAMLVGAAVFTDWLDGFLARRWNVVTVAGKLLDPFADALFCMIVFVMFAQKDLMWTWVVVVLVAREALVTFVLRPLALWRGVVVAAGWPGKVKTVTQFVLMLVVLSRLYSFLADFAPVKYLTWFGFFLVMGLSVASAGQYAVQVIGALRPRAGTPPTSGPLGPQSGG
jgi:CDP-diacylglycerol--glycerol-3-phosphate 3-phosphatidyltransferase